MNTTTLLEKVDEDIWIASGKTVQFYYLPFPTRMTIVRLKNGELFIHSPIKLTTELKTAVDALGVVHYVISPNKIHHLFMKEWAEAYPDALLFASPGLIKKRQDLDFDAHLTDTPETYWQQEIDQLIFSGSPLLQEVVFFHCPSKTLILADLIENFDPKTLNFRHRLITRLGCVLAPNGGTPLDWRLSFFDRSKAKESLQRILAWQQEKIIISHGIWIRENGTDFLRKSFHWLL